MLKVAEDGHDADLLLIEGNLRDTNQIEKAGSKEYLEYLFAKNGSPKDIDAYIDRIVNAFKKRSLISINSKLPSAIQTYDIDRIISDLDSEIRSLVMNTSPFETVLLGDTLDDTLRDILKRRENPGVAGIRTGFAEIDMYTGGLLPGENWYIGARPGMTKSAWVTKVHLNLGKNGIPSLMFNREMGIGQINERLFSIDSGVDFQNIKTGMLTDEETERIEESKKRLASYPIFMDHNYTGEIEYIVATIRKFHQLHGIKLVGLDYIQLVVERTGESTHELGRVSRQLKLLSNELGITTIVLSQLNRECEKRENKRPLMSDLRQSGNMEEDADIMVGLYRDELYNENSPDEGIVEFIIRKARNGPTGTLRLNFNKNCVNVYDQAEVFGGVFAGDR